MYKTECFKLRVSESGPDPLNLKNAKTLHEVRCEFPSLKAEPITIAADPFLFVHDDTLFLFYERKTMYSKADIVMECTKDLVHWSKPVIVLHEDFHLSFPFVFEDNGHVYMIPESCAAKSIRLYEADNKELSSFSYRCTLIEDESPESKEISYTDSSILKLYDSYYLFTSYRNRFHQNVAELYYSNSIFGPYRLHTKSPIVADNQYARGAGSILEIDGEKLRFAQDCEKRYGDNVHVFQIDNISEDNYSESLYLENVIPTEIDFYREGGHQYNSVVFNEQRIIATDAKEYHFFAINHILHRLLWEARKNARISDD